MEPSVSPPFEAAKRLLIVFCKGAEVISKPIVSPTLLTASPDRYASSDVTCVIEQLEERRFMSASLQIENLDILPGYERMVFTKVQQLDKNFPNKYKEFGSLRSATWAMPRCRCPA